MENEPVFLDANIFLDVARKRKGWEASATALAEIKRRNGFLSSLTVAIVYFIKLRTTPPVRARQETRELVEGLQIAAVTSEIIRQALDDLNIEDFEDAIQFYCANEVAKSMVTRNKRHHAAAGRDVEILTPEEYLSRG